MWRDRLLGRGGLLICGILLWLTGIQSVPAQDGLLPLPPPSHPDQLGAGIERTMHLLASSTAQRRQQVRVLFYGQSITEQDWWRKVADDLRSRFPTADLQIDNRAVGGFPAQELIKIAEHDVFALYPDLIIFHVYGSHHAYEALIRSIRSRTTAEVLIQTDHITHWPPAQIDKKKDGGAWWDDYMNGTFLPQTAAKYGCGLVDVRTGWLEYLRNNHLEPAALLLDDVHLNPAGCDLMARLIERYLVVRSNHDSSGAEAVVRSVPVPSEISWQNGRLVMPFRGNRVDLITTQSAKPAQRLTVLVDGSKPSADPSLLTISRPTPKPWSEIALIRVNHDAPLIEEDWTLTIDRYQENPAKWTFHVVGSKTGPDGSGQSDALFRSKSGRVRIEPENWFAKKPVDPGYQIRWSVVPQSVDVYVPPTQVDPALPQTTTLVQGLTNTSHVLELIAGLDGPPPVQALRVYRPPFVPLSPVVMGGAAAGGVCLVALSCGWGVRRWRDRAGSKRALLVGNGTAPPSPPLHEDRGQV